MVQVDRQVLKGLFSFWMRRGFCARSTSHPRSTLTPFLLYIRIGYIRLMKFEKKYLFVFGAVFILLILGDVLLHDHSGGIISPLIRFSSGFREEGVENMGGPLEKYYFESLRKERFAGGEINLEKIISKLDSDEIKKEEKYTSWLFSYQSNGKRVTGMANMPNLSGKLPVVVMLRGYADDEIYFTGLGTRKAAGVFAENGFITLAPDFLGFGGSDSSSINFLEARFERPVTVLSLLASIDNLPQANADKVFLWGHSNGGQIALSVLEITQELIPTTLWAPVTKGFPESVLYYMDDYEQLDDLGKEVKDRIDQFVDNYDEDKVSITSYFNDIKAPIQIHQGGADVWVLKEWSDKFVEEMKDLGKDVFYFRQRPNPVYFQYSQSDHNLKQDWDLVVERDLEFFQDYL